MVSSGQPLNRRQEENYLVESSAPTSHLSGGMTHTPRSSSPAHRLSCQSGRARAEGYGTANLLIRSRGASMALNVLPGQIRPTDRLTCHLCHGQPSFHGQRHGQKLETLAFLPLHCGRSQPVLEVIPTAPSAWHAAPDDSPP